MGVAYLIMLRIWRSSAEELSIFQESATYCEREILMDAESEAAVQ
jgi:hypothetical protein